jgi:hypothetical protein
MARGVRGRFANRPCNAALLRKETTGIANAAGDAKEVA